MIKPHSIVISVTKTYGNKLKIDLLNVNHYYVNIIMETFYEPDEILNFWFPNQSYQKWWFISNSQLDLEITNKYYNQMTQLYDNFQIENYIDANIQTNKIISDIILLDQFSRNIARVKNNIDINSYTKKAEILSNIWIGKKYYLTEPVKYTVFALLPIRHTKDKSKIKELLPVLEEIKHLNSNNSNPIYVKFLTHTLRALE